MVNANLFADFSAFPAPQDNGVELFEDLSAGIETENEPKTPFREVSLLSPKRVEAEHGSHAGRSSAVSLSLRNFTVVQERKTSRKAARARRGRGTTHPDGGGETRRRSLSAQRQRSWREPNLDIWSIFEEEEDTGIDGVPSPNIDTADDKAQINSSKEIVIFTTLANCNACRRMSGTLLQAWIVCPVEWVSWHLPQQQFTTTNLIEQMAALSSAVNNYQSWGKVARSFCTKCGTHVFGRRTPAPPEVLETIHVVLRTLDNDSLEMDGIKPDAHFQWHHGISWVKVMVSDGDKVLGSGKNLPRHPNESSLEVV